MKLNYKKETRIYEIHCGDMFSVNLDNFISEPLLWTRDFQIRKIDTYKRRYWWQFWKPKKTVIVSMMCVKGE